jgi:hypothetical protein
VGPAVVDELQLRRGAGPALELGDRGHADRPSERAGVFERLACHGVGRAAGCRAWRAGRARRGSRVRRAGARSGAADPVEVREGGGQRQGRHRDVAARSHRADERLQLAGMNGGKRSECAGWRSTCVQKSRTPPATRPAPPRWIARRTVFVLTSNRRRRSESAVARACDQRASPKSRVSARLRVAVGVAALSAVLLRDSRDHGRRRRFDVAGAVTITAALVATVYAVVEALGARAGPTAKRSACSRSRPC